VETTPPSKAQLLQSIENFLKKEVSSAEAQQCRLCGASMQFVDAHFVLTGSGMARKVSLPFCPVCDREILKELPRPETIH
jgi:formate dehydrogenase maturation protein FdhE